MLDANFTETTDEIVKHISEKIKNHKDKKSVLESLIVDLINTLNVPFCGATLQDLKTKTSPSSKKISPRSDDRNKYFVSPFVNVSVSAVGPVFYINNEDSKIYTLLQRRVRDDYQWWFPGGYVELPPANLEKILKDRTKNSTKNSYITLPSFKEIKRSTIDEYYNNIKKYGCWQKARQEINDPNFIAQLFKKHKVKWPKEIDYNWQDAWCREVKEEMGVDINKYKNSIIIDFKNHQTFMIGTERDRLINVDGRFCAMLGNLENEPKTIANEEIVEAKWIALEDISYDKKTKQFKTHGYGLNLYTSSLIEEALFEITCQKIRKISQIYNAQNQQKISQFNTPQNLQSYLLSNIGNSNLSKLKNIKKFLSWEFGNLAIAKNLCGKNADFFYKSSLAICSFVTSKKLSTSSDYLALEKLISKTV